MSDFDHPGTAAHTRAEEERSMGCDDNYSRIPDGYCAEDDHPVAVSLEDYEVSYHEDRWCDVLMHAKNECDEELGDLIAMDEKDLTLESLLLRVKAIREKVHEKIKEEYESFMAEHDLED